MFELDIHEIEMIENALKHKIRQLSMMRLNHTESTNICEDKLPRVKEIDDEIKAVNYLLGKIHNQKRWYRPEGIYISG